MFSDVGCPYSFNATHAESVYHYQTTLNVLKHEVLDFLYDHESTAQFSLV